MMGCCRRKTKAFEGDRDNDDNRYGLNWIYLPLEWILWLYNYLAIALTPLD
jgi:hypothetical protein